MRRLRQGLLIAASLAVSLSAPARAMAAACCGSGHGIGPTLTDAERAAFTVGFGFSSRVGQWTSERAFRPIPGSDFDRELHGELGWIVRPSGPVQLGVIAPMIYAFRRSGDTSSSGGGVGDITAFGRVDVLPSRPTDALPGLGLTLSALVPTGLPLQRSTDPLGADATGLGTAEIRPGFVIEKRWLTGFSATFMGSLGLRLPYHLEGGAAVAPAPRLSLLAAFGPFWSFGLSTSAGLLFEREAAPSIGGVASAAAGRIRTAAFAFVAYDLTARWTAVASAQIDLPISGLGMNEPLAVAPIVGVRRVWGSQD
jgi:hypothetical protein